MKEINIKKDELLKILDKNLKTHNKIYEKSVEKFKLSYVDRLNTMLKNAELDKFDTYFGVTEPISHKLDYEYTIRAIELENDKIITLSWDEFTKFVLNNWNWLGNFYAYYSSSSSSSSKSSISSSSSSSSSEEDEEINNFFKYVDK